MKTLHRLLYLLSAALLLATGLIAPLGAADILKRRVLVLPFDNIQKNKDYAWMSDSIAENLKTELLKTGRFEVLDVTLLRKIDPQMQFANLNAQTATLLASRLNCEVAIVGRFTAANKEGKPVVFFEADGVDALESKSVVVKKEDAPINAEIFDTVGRLAVSISEELNRKLEPLDASDFKRDNKLELLIYRLEHPPVGFLDALRIKNLVLRPAFDIDRFEYDVHLSYEQVAENPALEFEYDYWGKRRTPLITGTGMSCEKMACKPTSENPVLAIADENKPDAQKYAVRFHLPDARGPIIARWWVTAGYPYMTSLSANPAALDQGSTLPLDSLRGVAQLELGLLPGRWQKIPYDIRWAVAAQSFYGRGDFPQFDKNNPATLSIHLFSVGGGFRFDRVFAFGKRYSFAPFWGIYAQYQKYFREWNASVLNTMAMQSEIGLNQYYRSAPKSPWYYTLTLAAGTFFYEGQSLSYARIAVGVEYVIK